MDCSDSALDEAKRHLDHQIGLIQEQSFEALEVVKINLLILSVLIAATQLSNSVLGSVVFLVASIPLVLSIMVAILGYLRANPIIGLDRDGIYDLVEEDSIDDLLPRVYAEWIEKNHKKSTWNHRLIWLSLSLTAVSLGAVSGLIVFG